MKKINTILLSGASGFVGSALESYLTEQHYSVTRLVRSAKKTHHNNFYWDYEKNIWDKNVLQNKEGIIHLCGENIVNRRWSRKQKRLIKTSRIESTRYLTDKILSSDYNGIRVFLCASATGYYGNTGDEEVTENTVKGDGFLSDVVEEWEETAERLAEKNIRVCFLRFGIILDKKGGALQKMLLFYQNNLGSKLSKGNQYMSWISLEDTLEAIKFCLHNENLQGPVNITSPYPERNTDFHKKLLFAVQKKGFLPIPRILINLVLGEMGNSILLTSSRVQPKKLLDNGFQFKSPKLEMCFHKLFPTIE